MAESEGLTKQVRSSSRDTSPLHNIALASHKGETAVNFNIVGHHIIVLFQARAEEAVRRVESELANARSRAVQLEAALKAKSTQVERVNKLLDSTRVSEYERWVGTRDEGRGRYVRP